MERYFLDIILILVSIIGLIIFFMLYVNVSAVRKLLVEDKKNKETQNENLKNELERINRTLVSLERTSNKARL